MTAIRQTDVTVPLFGDDGSTLRVTVEWERTGPAGIFLHSMWPANVPLGRTSIRDLGPEKAAELRALIRAECEPPMPAPTPAPVFVEEECPGCSEIVAGHDVEGFECLDCGVNWNH